MKRFIRSIDKQIASSGGKNIFYDDSGLFQFIHDTINAIAKVKEVNREAEQFLVDYATDKAMEEFCRINQYYSFDSESKTDLRNIYADLFTEIRSEKDPTEEISKKHYLKLKNWLKKNNSFAEKLYVKAGKKIEPAACSEYSPELQTDILHLDIRQIMQPVLDIGCGKEGSLVNHYKTRGIEIYGIDRYRFTQPELITADWLEYTYGIHKWGTIISHLGFSNHFNHHHMREDGNYIGYGRAYMNILNSLKTGGRFHYAPGLPFIEKYLDGNQFALTKHEVGNFDFKTSLIKRLK